MIYFTSDLHFGHRNVMAYDRRPFATVEEMDAELIRRWNAKVKPQDTVYILGDISWYSASKSAEIMRSLNGRKILIKGNHDYNILKPELVSCFDAVYNCTQIRQDRKRIVLSHYPMPFYNHQHHGAYMLYGHVHNSAEWKLAEKYRRDLIDNGIPCNMYNVGCMHWNYEPVTLDEIINSKRLEDQ